MGMVQLPDEMQHAIEWEVAEGRVVTSTAFVEEAVRRLFDDRVVEDDAIGRAVEAGLADIEAGRFTAVVSRADEAALRDRVTTRLQERLSAGS